MVLRHLTQFARNRISLSGASIGRRVALAKPDSMWRPAHRGAYAQWVPATKGRRAWTGLEVTMSLRSSRAVVIGQLASACCVLTLLSCGHSPSAPAGELVVHVTQDGTGPAPGKQIEVGGKSLRGVSGVTDGNGLARFFLPGGSYVVRAYALGTPGPSRPYVEKSIEVQPAHESRAEFNDCTLCGSPGR